MPDPLVSIVIPCRNEAENLPSLLAEIGEAMRGRRFEVIVVDDGSTDRTDEVLAEETHKVQFPLRHVRHAQSAGQSMALKSGAWAARGAIVATLDGDGQNDPAYLPALVDTLDAAGEDCGMVQGQRLKRRDTLLKRWASRFANGLRNMVLRDNTRDTGCGLKAIRTDILRRLPFFDGTHRFVPALVIQEGYRIRHHDVIDRPRRHGKSNYGILDRGLQGALDLLGVWWLRRRRQKTPKAEEIRHD